MLPNNKTYNQIFKEIYGDSLEDLFNTISGTNPFFRQTVFQMLENLSDKIFNNNEERYYIDYKTNKILKFNNLKEYETFLASIKFNEDFEDRLK